MMSSLAFATTLADDYLYVTAAHLNVRATQSYKSSIVATVDNGYKVTVLESLDNGWKKVLLENGEIGYVNGRYLTEQAPYFEQAEGSNYQVSVPSAYVRGEGLVTKVAVLHKGDRLEVLDQKVFLGKWLRVRVLSSTHNRYNDRVGYISKKLVTVDENTAFAPVVEEIAPASEDTVATDESVQLNSAPAEDTTVSTEDASSAKQDSSSGTTTETESAEDEDLGNLLGDLLK